MLALSKSSLIYISLEVKYFGLEPTKNVHITISTDRIIIKIVPFISLKQIDFREF